MKIDKSRLSLRRATINDLNTIIEYRIIFLSETYGSPTPEMESSLKKSLTDYFTKSFSNSSFISWLALYDNKPIGFSGLVVREQPGNFEVPNGKTGYILNMFTLKDYRQNGICKMLMEKLIDDAMQLNLEKVELHATNEGEPVYRQYGFTEPHDKALEKSLI